MPFVKPEDFVEKEPVAGYRARFAHTEHMTVAHWRIRPNAPLPEHAHVHEQVVNMIEGEYELTVGGETRVLRAGDVVVIPSNVRHSGRSITDCRIIDVFCPVREDYR